MFENTITDETRIPRRFVSVRGLEGVYESLGIERNAIVDYISLSFQKPVKLPVNVILTPVETGGNWDISVKYLGKDMERWDKIKTEFIDRIVS